MPRILHLIHAMPLREMSNFDLSSLLLVLLLLLAFAQFLGYLFHASPPAESRWRDPSRRRPRPTPVGKISLGSASFLETAGRHATILSFIYWLGLLLLMFLSGAETRQLFTREERREVSWLVLVGTGLPFLIGLALGPWLAEPALAGPNSTRLSHHHSRRRSGRHFCPGDLEDLCRPENPRYSFRTIGPRRSRS